MSSHALFSSLETQRVESVASVTETAISCVLSGASGPTHTHTREYFVRYVESASLSEPRGPARISTKTARGFPQKPRADFHKNLLVSLPPSHSLVSWTRARKTRVERSREYTQTKERGSTTWDESPRLSLSSQRLSAPSSGPIRTRATSSEIARD